MDPQSVFCPNQACAARGQVGEGNIHVHSQKDRRYKCNVCGQTFAETKGTPYYRLRSAQEMVRVVITLLAYGCPLQAIVAALGVDERTVQAWQSRAGRHCQQIHEHLVEQPRDLGQVQADELRVKRQGGIVWIALALQVSTRLWLGGVISAQRNMGLIVALIERRLGSACALKRPLLVCIDGLVAYVRAIRQVFRTPLPRSGRAGRKRLQPWRGVYIAQVVNAMPDITS
jgi:transposase-like protein